jgi:hypothetical protein
LAILLSKGPDGRGQKQDQKKDRCEKFHQKPTIYLGCAAASAGTTLIL